jgi:hypothetical protein
MDFGGEAGGVGLCVMGGDVATCVVERCHCFLSGGCTGGGSGVGSGSGGMRTGATLPDHQTVKRAFSLAVWSTSQFESMVLSVADKGLEWFAAQRQLV